MYGTPEPIHGVRNFKKPFRDRRDCVKGLSDFMGKPKAISSPEELYSLFEAYKQWIVDTPYLIHDFVGKDAAEVHRRKTRPITWSGFEGYLARHNVISQLTHYEQNDRDSYHEYLPIIARIKAECRADVVDGALSGLYNANLAARIEGLKENMEVRSDNLNRNVEVSEDEAKRIIEAFMKQI